MRRRLWAFLWVLSLLLCVAMAALWVRSYFKDDSLGRFVEVRDGGDGIDEERFFESNAGRLYFGRNWHQYHFKGSDPNRLSDKRWNFQSVDATPDRLGPAYFPYNVDNPGYRSWMRGFDVKFLSMGHFYVRSQTGEDWEVRDNRAVNVAHWPVVLLFMILPSIRIWQGIRARRIRKLIQAGRCIKCGYDLRASDEKCPECGNLQLKRQSQI